MDSIGVNLQAAAELLMRPETRNVVILTHIAPDPDTIGSALALRGALRSLGKQVWAVCADRLSDRLRAIFNACGEDCSPRLDYDELTKYAGAAPDTSNANKLPPFGLSEEFFVVSVDAAADHLLGGWADEAQAGRIPDLMFDHHAVGTPFARFCYIDRASCSTGQIIAELCEILLPDGFPKPLASQLYCAIASDSGRFMYDSVTSQTLRIAARLYDCGIDAAELNRAVFNNKSFEQFQIERLCYNSLRLGHGGTIGVLSVTLAAKTAAGLDNVEVDGVAHIPLTIAGVEVGIILKQQLTDDGHEEYAVSLRSARYADVAAICARFGGGGHLHAAGCRISAPLAEAEHALLALAAEAIDAGKVQ